MRSLSVQTVIRLFSYIMNSLETIHISNPCKSNISLILKELCAATIKLQNIIGTILWSTLSNLIIHDLAIVGNIMGKMNLTQLFKDICCINKRAAKNIQSHESDQKKHHNRGEYPCKHRLIDI